VLSEHADVFATNGSLEVQLVDADGASVSADVAAGGSFSFGMRPVGTYTLRVLAGGTLPPHLFVVETSRTVLHDESSLRVGVLVSARNESATRLALTWDGAFAAHLGLHVAFAIPDPDASSNANCTVSEARPQVRALARMRVSMPPSLRSLSGRVDSRAVMCSAAAPCLRCQHQASQAARLQVRAS
jgi:hypothetical protein